MNDDQYILAIDPGVTTGWCTGILDDDSLILNPNEEKLSCADMYDELQECIDTFNPNFHVIYEGFAYRNASRMGLDLTPVKLIGVIEIMKERYEPLTTFFEQSASMAKGFYSDEKLKDIGAYAKGRKHGRDATRHLLHWLHFGPGAQFADIHSLAVKL